MITKAQLETLCGIVREAGAAIMELYASPVAVTAKADSSPLTEADMRADKIIRSRLEMEFPGTFILSEESVSDAATDEGAPFFLVDPLDGTKEFLNRNGEFTVNIALVDGALVAGVVYAPALDRLYFAARGIGAFRQAGAGAPVAIEVSAPAADRPLRVVGSRSHGSDSLQLWLDCVGGQHELVTVGSSLKFCMVAEGAADVYPRFGLTSQWDTAAAQCVLECAGGAVIDLDGAELSYGRARPILNPFFIAMGNPAMKEAACTAVAGMKAPAAIGRPSPR